jgi:hypothetical protein
MERISFDVDGVLTTDRGRRLARRKVLSGYDVWIVTARKQSDDNSAYDFAKDLGIRESHVVFTNGKDKWKFIQKYKIETHYDNNPEQLKKIKDNTKAKAILIR